jgi:Fur family ferric uptake transcriptional regulator
MSYPPGVPHGNETEAAEKLRASGLRVTRPRLLVYSTLLAAGGHRTVDDIVELLAHRGHAVSRMTVYNVAADLMGASLVMSAATGPGAAVYEASDRWHHHFVCRACGAIEDVPCTRGRKPCIEPPRALRARVEEAQVIFRGLCAACLKSGSNKGENHVH